MRKTEKKISIGNYNEYSIVTYTPSFLKSYKNRVKISNAILKIKINGLSAQTDKYFVKFIDDGISYLIDEFTLLENQTDVNIDVTDELQQWIYSDKTTMNFKIYGVSLEATGCEVVFDYSNIKSSFKNDSNHKFDIKRAGELNLDLVTGFFTLSHSDLKCSSNALPLTINHYYESINADTNDFVLLEDGKKDMFDYQTGKGWKTNFHQYIIKEKGENLFSDSETTGKFTYIDGIGNHIIFEEKYYYIKDEKKIYVHPSEVTIDMDNNLSILIGIKYYDVYREAKYKNLTLSGVLEGFKGIEYIQKDIDEITNLKSEIKSIEKNISECNRNIDYIGKNLHMLEYNNYVNSTNSKIQGLSNENELSELNLKYRIYENDPPSGSENEFEENATNVTLWGGTLNDDNSAVIGNGTVSGVMFNRTEINKENANLKLYLDHYNSDLYFFNKEKYETEKTLLEDQLEELNVLLKQKQHQLETLETQIPVYMIYDDEGNALGFSKTKDKTMFRLTFVSDMYNNAICINYKNDKIDNIIDINDNTIDFLYNDDGLLSKIVDFNSKYISFEYSADSYGNMTLLSKILYQDGTSSNYYYDSNNYLSYIIDSSGYGRHLEYEGLRVIRIKEIVGFSKIYKSVAEKIEDGYRIPNTSINYAEKNILEINYYDFKHTIVTNVLTNKYVSYLFDKHGKIITIYENKFDNAGILGNVSVKTYDRSNDQKYFIMESLPYSKNYLEGSNFTNNMTSEYILGEDILCGGEVYLTSYVQDEGDEDNKNAFVLNTNNPVMSKYVKDEYIQEITNSNITDLILSGWAQADSAWVDRRCTNSNLLNDEENKVDFDFYQDLILNDNDSYRNCRRFELKAELMYEHKVNEGETEVYSEEQYCSFDWMNTEWQYCAFPISIKDDSTYLLKSIKVSFDYSNNVGDAQFSNMELRKGNWEYYEYSTDGRKLYFEDSKTNNKVAYEYEDNKLVRETIINGDNQFVNKYHYNDLGSLIRKISYDGIINENEYDKKGKLIKSFIYHIDNPNSKIYSSNFSLDEKGNILAEMTDSGKSNVKYKYKENSNIITEIIDSEGHKVNLGYNLDESQLQSININVLGRNNYNTCSFDYNLLTNLSHNDFNFEFKRDGCGNLIETAIEGNSLFRTIIEDIIMPKMQATGDYKDVVVGKKITKELATNEIFVTYKNIEGITYLIEYYKNESSNKETILENQLDFVGNVNVIEDKLNGTNYMITYGEDGKVKNIEYSQNEKDIIIQNVNEKDTITSKKISIGENVKEYKYIYTEGPNKQLKEIEISNGLISGQSLDNLGRIKNIYLDNKAKTLEYLQVDDCITNLISDEWYSSKVDEQSDVYVRNENLNYSYDSKGNIVEIKENGKFKAKYEYDSVSRLIREDNFDFGETYLNDYDIGGNIISRRILPLTDKNTSEIDFGNVVNYLYKNNGWKDQLISFNGEIFKYDEIGNPIIYRGDSLEWSKGHLLKKYTNNKDQSVCSYEYNTEGIRISKTVSGKTTHFYLDETCIIAQDDGNLMDFHYGVDGILGFKYDKYGEYVYKKNILGDIIGICEKNGKQFVRYEYDSFGNHKIKIMVDDSYVDINLLSEHEDEIVKNHVFIANKNPFRYRGYYFDSETNLYYCNSRYYSPKIGRWISPDSIEYLDYKSINGLNLYAYCLNNYANAYDPTGHFVITLSTLLIGGAIAGAIGAGIGFGTAVYKDYKEDGVLFNGDITDYLGRTFGGFVAGFGVGVCTVLGAAVGVAALGGATATLLTSTGLTLSLGSALAIGSGVAFATGVAGYAVRTAISRSEDFKLQNMFVEGAFNAVSGALSVLGGYLGGLAGVHNTVFTGLSSRKGDVLLRIIVENVFTGGLKLTESFIKPYFMN